MEKRLGRRLAGALGGLLLLASAQAEITTVQVNVLVIAGPACELNGNQPIDVNFGDDLLTTRIDGSHYATAVPFTLVCTGDPSTLRLRFQGDGSDIDGNRVVQTDIPDLGIKLLKPDNSALNLGDWFTFAYTATPPAIKAVPVKRSGSTLPGGVFRGSATLLVEVL